jgi:hypothetical protein
VSIFILTKTPSTMRILLVLFFAVCTLTAGAQIIPNGDFEVIDDCPPAFDFDTTIGSSMNAWTAAQGTPDGYHTTCEAIAPENTPNIPPAEFGEGFAAFFAPLEAFGCELNEALLSDRQYCLTFDALMTNVVAPSEVEACKRFCVHGTNTPWTTPGGFDIPVPLNQMDDVTFLGCSEPVSNEDNWLEFEVEFETTQGYDYLLFTMDQSSDCLTEQSYIAVDNLEVGLCSGTGIEEVTAVELEVFPNPSAGEISIRTSGNGGVYTVMVTDVSGRKIFENQVVALQMTAPLQLSIEEPGFYFVQLIDTRGEIASVQQVVVN